MTPQSLEHARRVAQLYGVSINALLNTGERRGRRSVARWWLWKAMRDDGLSLPDIARQTNANHSSVIYGLRQLEKEGATIGKRIMRKRKPRAPRSQPRPLVPSPEMAAFMAAMREKHLREVRSRY